MWKKAGQLIFFLLLISAAALLQFAFIPALPPLAAAFNLVLILSLSILFFFDGRRALAAAIVAGFWLDILTFNFFGFHIGVLGLTVLIAAGVLRTWLTNRSLYAWLLLIVIATAIHEFIAGLLLYLFVYDGRSFFLVTADFWRQLAYQAADGLGAALLLFVLTAAASRRLRPFFLEKI